MKSELRTPMNGPKAMGLKARIARLQERLNTIDTYSRQLCPIIRAMEVDKMEVKAEIEQAIAELHNPRPGDS